MPKKQKPFPLSAFPTVMRDYIREASANVGCHPSYVALPLLASLARAIGNQYVLHLPNGWKYPAVIWGAIINESGDKKTHAQRKATDFLDRIQNKNPRIDIITDQANLAGISSLHTQQDTSLLVGPDELHGLLLSLSKGGTNFNDRGQWLSFWNAGKYQSSKRARVRIPKAAISVIGGIQPPVFRDLIAKEQKQRSGLLPRFLLTYHPPKRSSQIPTQTINSATKIAMKRVFDKWLDCSEGDGKTFVRTHPIELTPGGYGELEDFYKRNKTEADRLDHELRAAWIKLEQYAARFALIFQLVKQAPLKTIRGKPTVVNNVTMQQAIKLTEWFKQETKRIYKLLNESPEDTRRRDLKDLIKNNGGNITVTELRRASSKYGTVQKATDALNDLVAHNLATKRIDTHGKAGGRPVDRFTLKK